MHRKVLALLILLMYLAANECGLPPTLRSSEQKDVVNTVTEKQGSGDVLSSEVPETTSLPDVQGSGDQQNIDGAHKENCTNAETKEDNPQTQRSSPVEVSVELPGEESSTKQQESASDEVHKEPNTSAELLQDGSMLQREGSNKTNATEHRTKQQNENRASNNGHKDHSVLITAESKENKTSTVKKYLPKTPEPKIYQSTSLKDFHEDSPGNIKLQKQESKQVLKLVDSTTEKAVESLNNLQLLESARYDGQSSSVVLSSPVSSTEEYDSSSTENPGEAGDLDVEPQQINSPEHSVSSSDIKQETNTQEYFDPELYARPHLSEDLVTTNNALDPKPPVTTYSGFKPSFPVRTSIPQYAVKEDHPDDLAPHHFGHLPYALDRAKFIQYQQTASRYPYYVRVPLQRNLDVPYPVLVERKAQSFSLPLKVLVHPSVVVQSEDKVRYPATKPFSFTVHHGTPLQPENVHEDVGQGRS